MTPETAPRPAGAAPPIEESRRLFLAGKALEASPDRPRYVEALKAFLSYVDGHRKPLDPIAAEVGGRLDEVGWALYRLSEADLAGRALDTGLAFAPGSSSLLHHKAMVLLAQNRSVEQVLPLLDAALEGNPHDKQIWATKGDALKVLDRPADAAEAYLKAQQLDATSMQYVERALKVAPNHPVALRMKLQLARAHGGDRPALEACEALLKSNPSDGGLLLARAELLSSLGQADDALAALAKAREVRPDDPKLTLLRGRILLAQGQTPAAIEEFTKLLDTQGGADATALGEIADSLEKAGDLPRALGARQRLQELEPRNLGNLTMLRQLAAQEGKTDIALAACRTILETSPDNIEAMRAIAELLASAGRTDEALAAYRSLLRTHPHDIGEARHALQFAKVAGLLAEIVEFAHVILNEDPADAPTQEELARTLTLQGDREGALAAYDALLSLRPGNPGYLGEKRQLLTDLGRTDDLAGVYDELFRVDPTRSDLALERGHLYLTRAFDHPEGSPEREQAAREALVSYERASIDTTLVDRSGLGVARASRLVGDHERAIEAYRRFLAAPTNIHRADVLKEQGHALREVGRLSEAEAAYSQAVQLGLEDPDLFWAESEVLSLLNQEAQALRLVDLLLQREPANPLFLRRKGQLLLKLGRRSEGLQVLKDAVAGAQGDPHVYFEVAEALRASGAYADAIGYYQQGLAVDPHSRPGRLALVETMVLAGQHTAAIPVVDALLREDPNDIASWKARAEVYRRLQRTSDLQYSLKAILLLDPHHGPALLEQYRLHLERDERGDAYESLTMLLESGGPEASDPALLLQHGDLSAERGRIEEANRSYEKAAQVDPAQIGEIAARRARLRLSAGRPDLALEVLDETLKTLPGAGPKSASALLLRAEILTALERPAEAQAVYEEVRQREPKSPVAIAGVARALLDQGKHAEAREFLQGALPQVPASAGIYLLLAEAEAGLGAIPDAVTTVQRGVEALPKIPALWVRLGELQIAREVWNDAASAYAHAIALDGSDVELSLRAGFVAERLGHPNEALALYERATQLAPSSKNAWCSRGIALLAIGRPEEGLTSFERSLALDSDFEPAKEGKKAAVQKTRETQIERHGREALLLEAKLRRPVTKNDLFVSLHVPFDLLEPVLAAISRNPRIDLDRLSETEMRDLESASFHLIDTALERRPEGIERRGFTLADVAVLSPPTASLDQIQRLFGYLKTVLETDLRPENLRLTPDVEELARRALMLPANQRTLFQLVHSLRVGVFKARLIKVVESSGTAVHAPLPALDLGQYSPEFRGPGTAADAGPAVEGEQFFAPENVPAVAPSPAHGSTGHPDPSGHDPTSTGSLRCVGCGGIAGVLHECGAPLCQHCITQFPTCPKCGRAISPVSTRAIPIAGPAPHHSTGHAATHHSPRTTAPTEAVKAAAPTLRSPPPAKAKPPAPKPATGPKGVPVERAPALDVEPKAPPGEGAPAAAPRPSRPREKPDDEPRL